MKRASVRVLHLRTSAILKEVEKGEVFLIEKNGRVIAEIKPSLDNECAPFPDREAFFTSLPKMDTNVSLWQEEDRT